MLLIQKIDTNMQLRMDSILNQNIFFQFIIILSIY